MGAGARLDRHTRHMDATRTGLERRQRLAGMSDRAIGTWWTVYNPVLEAVPDEVWPDRPEEVIDAVGRLVDPHGFDRLEAKAAASSTIALQKAAAGRPLVTIDQHGDVVHLKPDDYWPSPEAMIDVLEDVIARRDAVALVGVSPSTWQRWRAGRTSPWQSPVEWWK